MVKHDEIKNNLSKIKKKVILHPLNTRENISSLSSAAYVLIIDGYNPVLKFDEKIFI